MLVSFVPLCVNGGSVVVFAHTLIPGQSHTLVDIDHAIISMAVLLPFSDSRRVVVSYKQNFVHKVLVKRGSAVAQW